MATLETAREGKTDFVKEVLGNDPRANTSAVNAAWQKAGRTGQISATLVNKLRSSLGLAGNLRARTKKLPQPAITRRVSIPGRSGDVSQKMRQPWRGLHVNGRKVDDSPPQASARGRVGARHYALEELEADFDRLLFKVMGVGGLERIEESLRQSRRLLYGGFNGNRT